MCRSQRRQAQGGRERSRGGGGGLPARQRSVRRACRVTGDGEELEEIDALVSVSVVKS